MDDPRKANAGADDWSTGLAAKMFHGTPAGMLITDADGIILAVNPAFTELTGYDPGEVLGKNPRLLSSGRHDRAFYEEMWRHIRERGSWAGEIWNRKKSGEVYPEWLSISAIVGDAGSVTHYAAMFSDITRAKISDERIMFLAQHDALTGLPNRILFEDRLGQALARATRNKTLVALMFVDVDTFKTINDTQGHASGDTVLQAVAGRLIGVMRQSDTLARLGGDEFAAILEDLKSADEALEKSQKLVEAQHRPIMVRGGHVQVTVSIGVAMYPEHAKSGRELLARADSAMYQAKHGGKDRSILFGRDR